MSLNPCLCQLTTPSWCSKRKSRHSGARAGCHFQPSCGTDQDLDHPVAPLSSKSHEPANGARSSCAALWSSLSSWALPLDCSKQSQTPARVAHWARCFVCWVQALERCCCASPLARPRDKPQHGSEDAVSAAFNKLLAAGAFEPARLLAFASFTAFPR